MASSKEKARNVRYGSEKKRITERMPRPGIRSRVKSTRPKRANTPHRRRQSYESVSIPQLVYELLTIDKYNQGEIRSTQLVFRLQAPILKHKVLFKKKSIELLTSPSSWVFKLGVKSSYIQHLSNIEFYSDYIYIHIIENR